MNVKEVVIGQDSALKALEGALNSGRLAHCYVFAGPEGTGRRTTALALAKALQCEGAAGQVKGASDGLEFCGTCAPCRQIEAGSHPDVLVWSDRPRAAWWLSGRGVRLHSGPLVMEEARQLRGEMSLTPAFGNGRVFIIDRADQMDTEPANSLLKTLEEPPGNRLLILLAENPGRLLPTILSRAQVVRFALVEQETISCWLKALLPGLDARILQRAVTFADGRPGRAHLFALNPALLDVAERAIGALASAFSNDPYAPLLAPALLQSAASEWHGLMGEGTPSGGAAEQEAEDPAKSDEREGPATEAATPDSQVAREYLPLLLNTVMSFLRQATLSERKIPDLTDVAEQIYGFPPDFYERLVPIVEVFLKRLDANVNVSLLLQLFCLQVSELGQEHPTEGKIARQEAQM